jgi:putative endonuclease
MSTKSERGRNAERRGRFAEFMAEIMLRAKGYRILARRMRNAAGEIDLIAKTLADVICFVEVKTRPDTDKAVAAVSSRQRARIVRAAEIYLAGRKGVRGVRFDVVCFVPCRLPRHIRDAWRPDEP